MVVTPNPVQPKEPLIKLSMSRIAGKIVMTDQRFSLKLITASIRQQSM